MLGMFDMFAGGALRRMTIFALNIMPYISASIILQLLTSVVPSLEALKKEGEQGRKKINQYTRYTTVLIAAVQAYGIAVGLEGMSGRVGPAVLDPGFFFRFTTVITLVGGTMFLMWLGEQITARGVGNGISLIIFSGIVANLPNALAADAGTGPHRRAVGRLHHRSVPRRRRGRRRSSSSWSAPSAASWCSIRSASRATACSAARRPICRSSSIPRASFRRSSRVRCCCCR